jgi:dTDP-4-amino-4,6-dideoxygalactose transaminase
LLRKENIGASVHFIPLHIHPYYRNTFGYRPDDFPNALRAYQRAITLPLYPRMSEADVRDVISAVRRIVQRHRVGRQL